MMNLRYLERNALFRFGLRLKDFQAKKPDESPDHHLRHDGALH